MKEVFIETSTSEVIAGNIFETEPTISEHTKNYIILMVHGYPENDCSEQSYFKQISQMLIKREMPHIRFDFRHCGQSGGTSSKFTLRSARDDITTVVNWARTKGYKKFGIIAEGLGAGISLLNYPSHFSFNIFSWPVFDFRHVVMQNFDLLNQKKFLEDNGYLMYEDFKVGKFLLEEMLEVRLDRFMQKINAPTLILHGAKDAKFPITQLDLVREHFGSRRVDLTSFEDGQTYLPDERHRKACLVHIGHFLDKYAV